MIQNPTCENRSYTRIMSELSEENNDKEAPDGMLPNLLETDGNKADTTAKEDQESPRLSNKVVECFESMDPSIQRTAVTDRLRRTFLLGKPLKLQVGNFDEVLDRLVQSEPQRSARQFAKISINRLLDSLDPEKTRDLELDQLWRESQCPPRYEAAEALLRSFRTNAIPTLTIRVEQHQFLCHAMLLQVISTYFQRPKPAYPAPYVFQLPSPVPVTTRAFVALYRWTMEPSFVMSGTLLVQVYRAAEFFDCRELINNCWQGLDAGSRQPDRTLRLYAYSRALGLHLEEGLLTRLGSIFLQFAASKQFLLMDASPMRRLLGLSTLAVNSESEVYLAAVLWLDYKWPRRKMHVLGIMDSIRFEMLPYAFLMSVATRRDGPPVVRMIANATAVRRRVFQTLALIGKSPRKFQGGCGAGHRNWIFDSRASHHHGISCRRVHYIDFKTFVNYLRFLHTAGPKHWQSVRIIDDPDVKCCPRENCK
ncbi:uncharacterized protein LOC108095323 [Drosophila ficusphila]|uniref:uncharacterized protein LOC108095323 n=1 Tax=Drosophila ficusphila TaxID=30025 RepID=UPI0007E8A91B|nr:uncharacterized protein LOC108095323 [Drosophila ficusphila]